MNSISRTNAIHYLPLQGVLNIPANDPLETEMTDVLEQAAGAISRNDDALGEQIASEHPQAIEILGDLLEKASAYLDPHDPSKFQLGFQLLPTKAVRLDQAGAMSVELNPVDMRFSSKSPVCPNSVGTLFIDSTPGQDGILYSIIGR